MQPNVLLLVVDSLRADRCWGEQRTCRTPVLDELRSNATVFRKAFSAASLTNICIASVLTGSYPFTHGIRSLAQGRLRSDQPTLAEAFRAQGYRTWAETTGPLEARTGFDRGFDTFRHRPYTDWMDTAFGEQIVAKLSATTDRPWFGYLHLWETHTPRRVTAAYTDPKYGSTLYDRAVSSFDTQLGRILRALPHNTIVILTGDHGEYLGATAGNVVGGVKTPIDWIKRRFPRLEKVRRRVMANMIKLLAASRRQNSELYRVWLGHGFHVFDSLVHVPLIVSGPGFPKGLELTNVVSHVDLFPTLAAACGLEHAELSQTNGVNLMPIVESRGAFGDDRAVYLESSGGRWNPSPNQWLVAVRTAHYKYVRGLVNTKLPEELYDLEHDPTERTNVIHNLPDVAVTLRARLDQLMSETVATTDGEATYSQEELARIHQHLRELGYTD